MITFVNSPFNWLLCHSPRHGSAAHSPLRRRVRRRTQNHESPGARAASRVPWQQLLPKNAEFQAVLQEKNCSTKQHQNGHGLTRMCAVIFTRKLGNLECSTLKFEMSKGTNPKSDLNP